MRNSLALILLLSLITACSPTHSLSDGTSQGPAKPPGEMYAQAMAEMKNKNYEKAAKALQSLLSRYPYGFYAQQAQMELAYAYYKHQDFDSALTAVDTFIKDYPTSPRLDYIYYLKGLINFDPDTSFFKNMAPRDPADVDPQTVDDSFAAFKELVTRFPNSMYAPDARVRMQYLANTLARHEIIVGSYYMRRGAYVAAIARAQTVLTEFGGTPQTMDALRILVQSYDALGMTKLRDDSQRVLDLNTRNASGAAASAPAATASVPAAKLAAAEPPAPAPAKP